MLLMLSVKDTFIIHIEIGTEEHLPHPVAIFFMPGHHTYFYLGTVHVIDLRWWTEESTYSNIRKNSFTVYIVMNCPYIVIHCPYFTAVPN